MTPYTRDQVEAVLGRDVADAYATWGYFVNK